MPVVRLHRGVRDRIVAHARRDAPNECCGLLIGTAHDVDECVAARNLDPDPRRYLLDPAEHIAANRRLRGSGRAVLGVYHSHPASPATPSPSDLREALYPEFVWVIVSLASPDAPDLAAYTIASGSATRMGITFL